MLRRYVQTNAFPEGRCGDGSKSRTRIKKFPIPHERVLWVCVYVWCWCWCSSYKLSVGTIRYSVVSKPVLLLLFCCFPSTTCRRTFTCCFPFWISCCGASDFDILFKSPNSLCKMSRSAIYSNFFFLFWNPLRHALSYVCRSTNFRLPIRCCYTTPVRCVQGCVLISVCFLQFSKNDASTFVNNKPGVNLYNIVDGNDDVPIHTSTQWPSNTCLTSVSLNGNRCNIKSPRFSKHYSWTGFYGSSYESSLMYLCTWY